MALEEFAVVQFVQVVNRNQALQAYRNYIFCFWLDKENIRRPYPFRLRVIDNLHGVLSMRHYLFPFEHYPLIRE